MKTADKIKQLYAHGMRKVDIAHELGIAKSTVSKHTPRQNKMMTDADVVAMKRMYALEKMSIPAIAEKMGVCKATVSNHLTGIEKRERVRKPRAKTGNKPGRPRKVTIEAPTPPKPAKPRGRPRKTVAAKVVKMDKRQEVLPTRPAIKEGTRPVLVKPGLIVHARLSVPEEVVRAKYLGR